MKSAAGPMMPPIKMLRTSIGHRMTLLLTGEGRGVRGRRQGRGERERSSIFVCAPAKEKLIIHREFLSTDLEILRD